MKLKLSLVPQAADDEDIQRWNKWGGGFLHDVFAVIMRFETMKNWKPTYDSGSEKLIFLKVHAEWGQSGETEASNT